MPETLSFTRVQHHLADIPALPAIRTSKEWRRYQVMLKRMSTAMDEAIISSIYGDRYNCNPPPTSYPPDRAPREWSFDVAHS